MRDWKECRAAAAGRGFVAPATRGDARERGAPWVSVPQVPRLRQPAGGRRGRSRRATNWPLGPELDLAAACPPPPQSDRSLWRETQMWALAKRMAEARLRTVCVRIGDLGSYAHAPKVRGPEERRHHVHHASRSKSQRLRLCAHLGVCALPGNVCCHVGTRRRLFASTGKTARD